jgi:general secretion pathway protein E
MDERFFRRHRLAVLTEAQEVWYSGKTPAWALASLLSQPGLAGFRSLEKSEELIDDHLLSSSQEATAADVIGNAQLGEGLALLLQESVSLGDGDELDDDAPVIRMINAILNEAAARKASDIHLEPYETGSVVRFRVDGLLQDVAHPPRALHAALISRIKVMAQLDIAEKRLPQDGRMTVKSPVGLIDLRISTLPTGFGERAVLRLLAKGQGPLKLQEVGMSPNTLQRFRSLVGRPFGILLVTGPTGSGKTTTLYAALSELDAKTRNIMTVEDPIEYDMPGIAQTQVHPKIGLSFAQSLRSILRQDPDVILIGEIRDLETAQIAIQASLTGHLVLATLHTNDSTAAVSRLLDMGVEPFLLSSSLIGVLAQRLVRQRCQTCAPRALMGCDECGQSGYKGRLGIFELMAVDDAIRAAIKQRADASEIRQLALGMGSFLPLQQDGLRLVRAGVTTEQELARVTASGHEELV